MSEPDVVDFLPLPVYPLLGVQVHCVRWQKIVQGMKKKGVVVRVHRESDRGGLFKAASRLRREADEPQVLRCGRGRAQLARAHPRGERPERRRTSTPRTRPPPTAAATGPWASSSSSAARFPCGAATWPSPSTARCASSSATAGLAGRRQRNAVVVTPGRRRRVHRLGRPEHPRRLLGAREEQDSGRLTRGPARSYKRGMREISSEHAPP